MNGKQSPFLIRFTPLTILCSAMKKIFSDKNKDSTAWFFFLTGLLYRPQRPNSTRNN